MMSELPELSIKSCLSSETSFCKFIAPNDTKSTGSHQNGILIPLNAYYILFDSHGKRSNTEERKVTIKWQDEFETKTKFKYYGSKNEYRITSFRKDYRTKFGKSFSLLTDESVGSLFILAKKDKENYEAFLLNTEEEIETFLIYFGLSPAETNKIITISGITQLSLSSDYYFDQLFNEYVNDLEVEFPTTTEVSKTARILCEKVKGRQLQNDRDILNDPDGELLKWLDIEYNLFKTIENNRYAPYIRQPLNSVEELIVLSNKILNRRKSRAGKSLENHLIEMFTLHDLSFTHQPITEGKKRPDFIFPGETYYFNDEYKDNLVFLASKTTCKDRWRQILNEADRIEQKHLFTLQQGISRNQLEEMFDYNVRLVVPKDYLSYYPSAYRDQILTLGKFIVYTKEKCNC